MTVYAIPENFLEIPFTGVNHDEKLTITLDGIECKLRFAWSNRSESWSMSLFDADEVLLSGPKLIKINSEIGKYRKTDGMPPGSFACLNYGTEDIVPTRDNFGLRKTVRLYYVAAISA